MLSLRAGQNRSYEGLNNNLTHGFILEFASQDDLDWYHMYDPVHIAFSKEVVAKGLVEDSVVLDIFDGSLMLQPGEMPRRPGTRDGACHCGAVRFEAELPEESQHVLCHCQTCRSLSGGAFSCNQIIAKNKLRILEGEALKKYTYAGASGKGVDCYFCGICTSHVYHEQEAMPGKVVVRTLLLVGAEAWGVGGEIFGAGRLGWVRDMEGNLPDPKSTKVEGKVNGVANGE